MRKTSILGNDGKRYVKVTDDIPLENGTFIRETFQRVGKVGERFTTYFKIAQSQSDKTPPTFVVAERRNP